MKTFQRRPSTGSPSDGMSKPVPEEIVSHGFGRGSSHDESTRFTLLQDLTGYNQDQVLRLVMGCDLGWRVRMTVQSSWAGAMGAGHGPVVGEG